MADDRVKIGIRTSNGNYVTAVNGGGIGEDANALPIHTDAVIVQDWEKFQLWFNDDGTCNIETSGTYFLTAVNGGGIAAPAGSPVATDATEIGEFETFTLEQLDEKIYAFKTFDGHYVTAVNGGGMSTAGAPLHTEEGPPSTSQTFILVPVRDEDEPTKTTNLAAIESESCEK